MNNTVALVRCEDYDFARVESAVRRNIDLLGGMKHFVQPGQRVLLKPNLLRSLSPDKACTTHPTVVAAVARLVVEAGGHPVIVESPGGPYSSAYLRMIFRKTEMTWAAEVSGAELNENYQSVQVSHPDGKVLHRLDLVEAATQVDVVINLAKLKTHNLTTLTLCVKNLFGLVPGVVKIGYHSKLQGRALFAEGLVDLLTYIKPQLNLIDAVTGMEGDGPSGGDPRPIGALLAGSDALAVDTVAAALVGLDPLAVLTTRVAAARGLTTGRIEDIDLLGDALASLQVADWRLGAATPVDPGLVPGKLRGLLDKEAADDSPKRKGLFTWMSSGWFGRQLVVMPHAGDKCTGCGSCAKNCPVSAIQVIDHHVQMDQDKCIRCYCCHELCPELAVELERPWLGRLLIGK